MKSSKLIFTTQDLAKDTVHAGQGCTFEKLENGNVRHVWIGANATPYFMTYSPETWAKIIALGVEK